MIFSCHSEKLRPGTADEHLGLKPPWQGFLMNGKRGDEMIDEHADLIITIAAKVLVTGIVTTAIYPAVAEEFFKMIRTVEVLCQE